MSSSHAAFSAAVIMIAHSSPYRCSRSGIEMMSAGRRSRAALSVYGNGTEITSKRSKVGIALPIRFRCPLGKAGERIVLFWCGADLLDLAVLDQECEVVARSNAENLPDWLRHHELRLGAEPSFHKCIRHVIPPTVIPVGMLEFLLWESRFKLSRCHP